MGVHVTLLTASSAVNRITKSAAAMPRGVTFLGFSDGHDEGLKAGMDFEVYMTDLRRCGLEAVATAITASGDNGKPIVHVVYTTLLPWVSQAARDLHVASTFLWIQPATILDIYYYSFYGYGDVLNERKTSNPSWSIELPGLPQLTGSDLPSFLLAPNAHKFALPLFKEHIDTLDEETNPKILVNSFDALELEALRAIKKLNFVAIGPLIPSAFLDGKDPSDNSFGGDLLQKSDDYIEWLDSKPRRSVIYVAFGSYSALVKQQTEEVARGRLDCQGHINPSLQFARRLVRMGVNVTFVTAISALKRVTKSVTDTPGLTLSGFSDGYDDGNGHLWNNHDDADRYMKELKIRGSEAIAELIKSAAERGKPFVHVVYTTIMGWVGQVAHALQVPSTLLWLQPATILGIYYYYFNGYGESIGKNANDPTWFVELPGLPLLTRGDLPSFLLASSTSNFALPLINAHFDVLNTETNPKVLINSFDALESGALRATERLNFVAVGPLIPSAFLDGDDPSDNSSGGDLFQHSEDYIVWLNSKPSESVIYAAFGSYASITKRQMEEIERGLLECGRPFLWVTIGSVVLPLRSELPNPSRDLDQYKMVM
ncbi:hypothetical protein RHSIM_Rhsim02G0068100 [Rhododendron simsii]|uniref:Uncharacterized protein n=1 Tax=Rhododendron simsii TaxID=118357 RepID=A0A834HB02_RHOSS|nr:hypothetical protein RHSIM_Rhsim02G0068100 [Rhododendron simsii]